MKSVPRWQYLLAFVLVLNAGFFVFLLRPWQWGANKHWNRNGVSAGQISETGRQADMVGPPAPLAQTGKKQETSEIRPVEKEKTGLDPAATDTARAVSVPGKGMEDERGKTQSAGGGLEVSGPSETAASGTPGPESAGRHVSENKIDTAGPGAKQGSGTTRAALKKSAGSEPSKTSTVVGTKQGLAPKTAKSQTAAIKPPVEAQQPLQQRAAGGIVSDLQDFAKLETSSSSKPDVPAVPKWYELTPEIRDAIPEIRVSMLVYSLKPEERWINVNGSKKKEGQEVSPGLKLMQINQNGAIFSYNGQRFFKAIMGD
jgi:hypothetical protein